MPATTTPVAVSVAAPTVDHHRRAFGIGSARPRLSWVVEVAPTGWRQARYELELDTGSGSAERVSVASADSVLVDWPFAPLESRQRALVRVRLTGAHGGASEWSHETEIETGLLQPSDWTARAISPRDPLPSDGDNQPWLLRTDFTARPGIRTARLYITAQGVYEAEINGQRVGDDILSPGWTDYRSRLRYYSYDVSALVIAGENAIGAHLADGWFRGRLGFRGGHPNIYGDRVALLAQLEIVYDDGSRDVVRTDRTWKASAGALQTANLLRGESHDQRLAVAGWSSAGAATEAWGGVDEVPLNTATLVAPEGPPVRCTEERAPVSVTARGEDSYLLDFGQNLVGRLRITVHGHAGQRIRLRHAEVLQNGDLYTKPLRGATSTDEYVIGSSDEETWEPRFTIHGFRYAEVSGWRGGPIKDMVRARIIHTDMRRTGDFGCSDPLITRLHENVVWSMRGNFVDLPTDCPQRDERLGWTGDIQVFAPTASFLYDCSGLLSSWLKDVASEQLSDGTVPWYVPVIPGGPEWTPIRPGAGWGDVVTLTPWTLFERFGDLEILRAQWESAQAWVDLVLRLSDDDLVWRRGFQLGDWLDPTAPPNDPADGQTDRYLVATAYSYRSAQHLGLIAAALGKKSDAVYYDSVARQIRTGFRSAYLNKESRLTSDSQAAYAIAITFGLFDAAERPRAGVHLAELVELAGHTIRTGFLGTPVILDALSSTGQRETAYRLLTQTECPSWLYPVTQGATTIWERWDSLLPDGTVNPGDMTSFNHYALGAVADWLHREVAGVQSAAPGYRAVRFAPAPGGGIDSAKASYESPYGRIAIEWSSKQGELRVLTTVPHGVEAHLELPDGSRIAVRAGDSTHTSKVTTVSA